MLLLIRVGVVVTARFACRGLFSRLCRKSARPVIPANGNPMAWAPALAGVTIALIPIPMGGPQTHVALSRNLGRERPKGRKKVAPGVSPGLRTAPHVFLPRLRTALAPREARQEVARGSPYPRLVPWATLFRPLRGLDPAFLALWTRHRAGTQGKLREEFLNSRIKQIRRFFVACGRSEKFGRCSVSGHDFSRAVCGQSAVSALAAEGSGAKSPLFIANFRHG